jgi:cell division protein FtsB
MRDIVEAVRRKLNAEIAALEAENARLTASVAGLELRHAEVMKHVDHMQEVETPVHHGVSHTDLIPVTKREVELRARVAELDASAEILAGTITAMQEERAAELIAAHDAEFKDVTPPAPAPPSRAELLP